MDTFTDCLGAPLCSVSGVAVLRGLLGTTNLDLLMSTQCTGVEYDPPVS